MEQYAGLGPLSAGLAVALKLTVYTGHHEFMLSLPILTQHCRIHSGFLLSMFVAPYLTKRNLVAIVFTMLTYMIKSHCYL